MSDPTRRQPDGPCTHEEGQCASARPTHRRRPGVNVQQHAGTIDGTNMSCSGRPEADWPRRNMAAPPRRWSRAGAQGRHADRLRHLRGRRNEEGNTCEVDPLATACAQGNSCLVNTDGTYTCQADDELMAPPATTALLHRGRGLSAGAWWYADRLRHLRRREQEGNTQQVDLSDGLRPATRLVNTDGTYTCQADDDGQRLQRRPRTEISGACQVARRSTGGLRALQRRGQHLRGRSRRRPAPGRRPASRTPATHRR